MFLNKTLAILFLSFFIISCNKDNLIHKSNFKIISDYTDFSNKMENNDTLKIGVNLSICMSREYDDIEITKTNDTLYLQIKNKYIEFEDPITFPKIIYQTEHDSISLEKMIKSFDINYQEEISSPFFVISNPKETDTIILRGQNGLSSRNRNIINYINFMSKLYPKEMELQRGKFFTPLAP